ncbi:MAG: peptidylprolyl isomerase [Chloroflexi bacterium]|nr:peptidylprolyl isomerase [Chloroflexota bacterium]MCY3911788.1 peptidylprolyl isomerase [Chloroflexota bacterium]
MQIDSEESYTAVVTTNLGQMTFELLPAEAPLAVNNFVVLARNRYYDGVVFHRLIPRFMAQSGDPTGLGTGGPGYTFAIEPPQRPYVRGSLAMANTGRPHSNGSQFFIVFDDLTALGRLSPDYSLFGQMVEGEDTLAKIEAVPVGVAGTGERSRPQETITITSIEIHEG